MQHADVTNYQYQEESLMKADIINYDETLCLFHSLVMQCNLKIAQYNKPINIKE